MIAMLLSRARSNVHVLTVLPEIDTCQINRLHLVSLQYSSESLLTKLIAAKRASAEQLLTNRHDDEIASIADFSDDEEKEMCVISL